MNMSKNIYQEPIVPFPLRIEIDLKCEATKEAKKRRQSLNSWVLTAIEERIARDQERAA